MTRKLLAVAASITMMFALSGATAPDADAQCGYYNQIVTCGPVLPYPEGGFSNAPATAGAAGGAASTSAGVSAGVAATTGTTSQGLALTGADSGTLGYIGAGLVGAGCLAAASARRRSNNN